MQRCISMENNYIRTRWLSEEIETLSSALTDGIELQTLQELLPQRSPKAIMKKALDFNYRSKTINGITVIKFGVNRRVRRQGRNEVVGETVPTETAITIVGETRVTTNNSTPTTSSETITTESDASIAQVTLISQMSGKEVNKRAIQALESNNIIVDADSIYAISKHIARTEELLCTQR